MTKEDILNKVEELITPLLFEWHDTYYASDGKLERKDYLTCFLIGYKFIKTDTNFQILRTNVNMRNSGQKSDYYNITEHIAMLHDCLYKLKQYDWSKL